MLNIRVKDMKKLGVDVNVVNWFEIPVLDTERAKKFYEALFDIEMQTQEMNGMEMTFFPMDPSMSSGKVSGALVKGEHMVPSKAGVLIYFNANPSIQLIEDKIEAAGGKVVQPKMLIADDIGYLTFFIDTEGNRLALHASS
jgi:predicted enzyme related to lactoylglutathione lyase